ncbi:MAG: hypothetical protein SO053_02185 [Bifidobacterium animalis]|nr:hypothetical protein [Bifidobacterium animalis]
MSRRRIARLLVEGESYATLLTPSFNALFPTLNMPHRTQGEPLRCDVTTVSLFPDDARFNGLNPRDNASTMVRKTVIRQSRVQPVTDGASDSRSGKAV